MKKEEHWYMITVFCQGRTRTYHIYIRRNEKEEFNTIEKVKALFENARVEEKDFPYHKDNFNTFIERYSSNQ